MKLIQYIIILSLITVCYSFSFGQTSNTAIKWIPFKWDADTISGHFFPKTEIDLPLTIEGIDKQFRAQFDMGAGVSMLYGNTFAPFFKSYPLLNQKIDVKKTGWINSKKYPYLNVPFSLGEYKIPNNGLVWYKNYGENLSRKQAEKQNDILIGTFGCDILQNKILIIDYPNERMAIVDSLPKDIESRYTFTESLLDNEGRMLIQVIIDGKKENLLFDTGSSLFNLITDTEHWKSVTDQSKITDTLSISAWGEMKKVYGSPINVPMNIAGKNITGKVAYGEPDENQKRFYENEHIFGITGNSLFFDNVIILDFKNKRFGIENKGK